MNSGHAFELSGVVKFFACAFGEALRGTLPQASEGMVGVNVQEELGNNQRRDFASRGSCLGFLASVHGGQHGQ